MATEPFDLISMYVRCGNLNGLRQVQDDLPIMRGLPDINNRLTDLQRKIDFGEGEAFRRVFKSDMCTSKCWDQIFNQTCATRCDLDDLRLLHTKDYPALLWRCGVIHMHNGSFYTLYRLKCTLDQLVTCLYKDLDSYIIGYMLFFYKATYKIKLVLGGRRETNFDLLKANCDQEFEHC